MHLIRDVLDKQALDKNKTKIGKIDGILIESGADSPPRVIAVELGSIVLARRLGPGMGRWASHIAERLGGARHRSPPRIPWSRVRNIGLEVELDVEVGETQIFVWQRWLRDKIIRHIPGA